jgi:hypothetical protein
MTDTDYFTVPGGQIRVQSHCAQQPLSELLDFATRANPKRPFLFVSKVLGRHIPCRPARMRQTYHLLSAPWQFAPGPIWIVGLAETATGLGAGIADTVIKTTARTDVYSQQTTRFELTQAPLVQFEEGHSHAPTHLLHQPLAHHQSAFQATRTLVVVDDEISTGRSVQQLIEALLTHLQQVDQVIIVTLVNWLTPTNRQLFAQAINAQLSRPVTLAWYSLFDGEFTFLPDQQFQAAALPTNAVPRTQALPVREDLGRRGSRLLCYDMVTMLCEQIDVPRALPIALIGSGECAFIPFRVAETLEHHDYDVTFQCITRSPVCLGAAIRASLSCPDPYQQHVGYYLHNPPHASRQVIAIYELEAACAAAAIAHPEWICLTVPTITTAKR